MTESNQHGPRLDISSFRTNPLKKGTDHGRHGGSTPSCFCLTVRFLLSPPLFLLLPFLLHRWPLRRHHTVNAGRFLSSGILGDRPLRTGRRRRGLGEFFGARDAVGRSPDHLDRIAPDPPAPTGEWFNEVP